MLIKFIHGYRAYIKGDLAGFEENVARFLVDNRYAEFVDPKDADEYVDETLPKMERIPLCPICGVVLENCDEVKLHKWNIHQIKSE